MRLKIPYKEALGNLIYAYQVTPDLSSVISILGSFAEKPGKAHWNTIKCVLLYLKGTINLKLKLKIVSLIFIFALKIHF